MLFGDAENNIAFQFLAANQAYTNRKMTDSQVGLHTIYRLSTRINPYRPESSRINFSAYAGSCLFIELY